MHHYGVHSLHITQSSVMVIDLRHMSAKPPAPLPHLLSANGLQELMVHGYYDLFVFNL